MKLYILLRGREKNDVIRTTSLVDLECLSFVEECLDQHQYIMDHHGMVDHQMQLETKRLMFVKDMFIIIPGATLTGTCGGIKATTGVVSPDGNATTAGCGTAGW